MKVWKKILKKALLFFVECAVLGVLLSFLLKALGIDINNDILCVLIFGVILWIDLDELKEELDRGGRR